MVKSSTTPASRRSASRQGRPPGSDSEVTRKRIMDAAQLCFGEHGYKESSNRTIAEMAGVTTGTIYHYFENKRELFLAIHEETQKDIVERLRSIVDAEMNLADSITAMLRIFMQLFIEKPNYHKFNAVVRTEALRNPEIAPARVDHEWRSLYAILSQRGMKTGEIEKQNKRAMQTVLGALTLGLTQHAFEASLSDHKECLRGLELLFHGDLLLAPAKS